MLEFRAVSKTFHLSGTSVRALSGVSFSLSPGEFAAVHGPSGCGKSTLLLCAGTLQRPDSGQVLIDGQDVYALGTRQLMDQRSRRIGFIFQQFHLVPYLTVLENVLCAVPSEPRPDVGRARSLLGRFQLAFREKHRPHQLSIGEQQRVALARALMNDPAIVLADEPTGNLDDANTRIVATYLAELAAEGRTVLVVTHDARIVQAADRTLRMEAGELTDADDRVVCEPIPERAVAVA